MVVDASLLRVGELLVYAEYVDDRKVENSGYANRDGCSVVLLILVLDVELSGGPRKEDIRVDLARKHRLRQAGWR